MNIIKQTISAAILVVCGLAIPASAGPTTVIDGGSLRLQKRVQYLSTQQTLMNGDFTELKLAYDMIRKAHDTADAGNMNLARVQIDEGIRQFRNHYAACMTNLERGIDSKMQMLFSILGADPNTSDAQRTRYMEMAKQLKVNLKEALAANDEFRISLLKIRLKHVYLLLQGPAAINISDATHQQVQDGLKRSIILGNQAILRLAEQSLQFDVLEVVAGSWGMELEFTH